MPGEGMIVIIEKDSGEFYYWMGCVEPVMIIPAL
jgi:hypothetical protein